MDVRPAARVPVTNTPAPANAEEASEKFAVAPPSPTITDLLDEL